MTRLYDNLGRELVVTGFGQEVDREGKRRNYFVYEFVSRFEPKDGLIGYYDSYDKDKFTVMSF